MLLIIALLITFASANTPQTSAGAKTPTDDKKADDKKSQGPKVVPKRPKSSFVSKNCPYGREYDWKECNEKTSSMKEYLFKQTHVAIEGVKDDNGIMGKFCRQKFKFDLENKYCAYYTKLKKRYIKGGAIFQSVFRVEDQTLLGNKELTEGQYSMDIQVGTDQVGNTDAYLDDWGKNRITMSPQVTNITRDEDGLVDFSIRNFYEGKCIDENYCNRIEIESIGLVNTYPADMIIILNDHRAQFVSKRWSWNMEPIKVTVTVYHRDLSKENDWKTSRPKEKRVAQQVSYYINVEYQWLDFYTFLQWDFDSIKWDNPQWQKDFAGFVNFILMYLTFAVLIVHLVRRYFNFMKKEIKYTQILKKFDDGADGTKHLELNLRDDDRDYVYDELEEQRYLLNDVIQEEEEEDIIVEREETGETDSEISHYIEGEDGRIERVMIKKARAKELKQQIDFEKSGTWKNGIMGHMNSGDLDGMASEGTEDAVRVKGGIKRSAGMLDEDDQRIEDAPEFIDSEGYADMIGRSIDQHYLQQKSLEMLHDDNPLKINLKNLKKNKDLDEERHNTPTLDGVYKKKRGMTNRHKGSGIDLTVKRGGPLTSRSNHDFADDASAVMHISRRKGGLEERAGSQNLRDRSPYREIQRLNESIQRQNRKGRGLYNDDSIGQLDILDQNIYIGSIGQKRIDQTDERAIKSWYKNVKKRKGRAGEKVLRRSNSGEIINDLIKISKLYKVYGNDQVALVNPADRPGVIQVKKRAQIKDRVYKQMGLDKNQQQMAITQISKSNINNNSAMQSYMGNDGVMSHIAGQMPSVAGFEKENYSHQVPDYINQESALNNMNMDRSQMAFENQMNEITNEYNSKIQQDKSVAGKHSVSHMQQSNNNKAFRGYANVVDPKSPNMNIQVNQNLNEQSGVELPHGMNHNTSGSSIGFQTKDQNHRTDSRFNDIDNISRNNVKKVLPKELTSQSRLNMQDGSVIDHDRNSAYDYNGSPRNPAEFIEIDVDNRDQMVELSKDVKEYRKRKQERIEQKMNPQKSVMRNPTSKGNMSVQKKGSIADKSRQTFQTGTVQSRK